MAKNTLDFEKPIVELENKIDEMKKYEGQLDISGEVKKLEEKVEELKKNIYQNLTRWQKVQLARHPERPSTLDYIYMMTTDFVELHGDRLFKDDKAIVGGFAKLDGQKVMIIGHQKGRDTKSNLYRNFGMPNPEGYRKALRLMKLAEKFNKPVITMLDTPGAYPGLEAEQRGQAEAIARNLLEMSRLKVPIIVVIIGEGASGGALGIGVGDRILMLQNTWYSVISPESCSSILWRSWDFKEQAAEALKLTAGDLLEQGIIDRIIEEPLGGAHKDPQKMADILKDILKEELNALIKIKPDKLIQNRLEKFGKMGVYEE
ncbi:Acetyl-CoA carboxylase, alpha subunit [Melioribacter roseus P3M-2]|uniref:Acetyl-coenzyme A carboxylase carboxyl transferase subunit alpha n=1 Tax=Melioribacter roseus (strain DSM 23840 / JCM 17771 / VKM B-2668 / P3M-2) TaxID=1191523 RepID=I6ZWV1_MELRP|nr:acetyl-CoA carboxylase carboxyltransferase subunit alpha [Melioribacter roseus]AFN73538.1 Acetyl-CoA carboxylase, alpha subunit [Melioribacter roseus P3M-2]